MNADFVWRYSEQCVWKTQKAPVGHLSLKELMPDTDGYMTYEGSTTHPGCWETTVWVIVNKPIYMSAQELYALRRLMQGTKETPKAPLGNNRRPIQLLHHRTIRTNIDFRKAPDAKCPSMVPTTHYRGNITFKIYFDSLDVAAIIRNKFDLNLKR
ncbi:hypothetical protein G9C98_001103 [Cotesia typhae]|uniref:Alpha-carbonic anhydrase domain-containing protein n=1 Tax=Cotesia typhae TaxID=2053667 RepID=A0A8J5QME7_9HYME|nr:hypothetical protein G9C98_001103 [Cotesia typhae]